MIDDSNKVFGGMRIGKGNGRTLRIPALNAILSTTNPT
jgi:hypothetical protein